MARKYKRDGKGRFASLGKSYLKGKARRVDKRKARAARPPSKLGRAVTKAASQRDVAVPLLLAGSIVAKRLDKGNRRAKLRF